MLTVGERHRRLELGTLEHILVTAFSWQGFLTGVIVVKGELSFSWNLLLQHGVHPWKLSSTVALVCI